MRKDLITLKARVIISRSVTISYRSKEAKLILLRKSFKFLTLVTKTTIV